MVILSPSESVTTWLLLLWGAPWSLISIGLIKAWHLEDRLIGLLLTLQAIGCVGSASALRQANHRLARYSALLAALIWLGIAAYLWRDIQSGNVNATSIAISMVLVPVGLALSLFWISYWVGRSSTDVDQPEHLSVLIPLHGRSWAEKFAIWLVFFWGIVTLGDGGLMAIGDTLFRVHGFFCLVAVLSCLFRWRFLARCLFGLASLCLIGFARSMLLGIGRIPQRAPDRLDEITLGVSALVLSVVFVVVGWWLSRQENE